MRTAIRFCKWHARNLIIRAAIISLATLVRLLPSSALMPLGRGLGRSVYAILPWRLKFLRSNARMVASGRQFECAAYEHLGCALVLALLPPERAAQLGRAARVDTGGHQALESLRHDLGAGGVVLCTAHVGVWEMLPGVLAPLLPLHTCGQALCIYRPLHDPWLDAFLRVRRRASGLTLLPSQGSLPQLCDAVEAGGAVGLVADQRPSARRGAVAARFLGRAAAFSPGLGLLHRRTGAPVWFAALMLEPKPPRAADARPEGPQHAATGPALRLHLDRLAPRAAPMSAPAAPESDPDDELKVEGGDCARLAALTQAYADALHQLVTREPAAYFWFKSHM
jgi:lauroyl/myristoyl acyltransferase